MRKALSFIIFTFISLYTFSQTLFRLGEEEISESEFIEYYENNNSGDVEKTAENFINYRLKLLDAKHIASKFKYTIQENLREQFLSSLIPEEYLLEQIKTERERLNSKLRISHIFISLKNISSQKDIESAFHKADGIIRRIKEGEKFSEVAKSTSDEIFVHRTGGDMGYITAMQLPPQVEQVAYTMGTDSISKPIKTKDGIYIIKVLRQRKNDRIYKVAHIMCESKEKIVEAYKLYVNKRKSFGEIASNYSIDNESKNNDGELDWFETGIMPIGFEVKVMKLKNGEVTKPFKINGKWHFIKLLATKSPNYSEKEIKDRLLSKYFLKYQVENLISKRKQERYYLTSNKAVSNVKFLLREYGLDSLKKHNYVMKSQIIRIQENEWKVRDFVYFLSQNTLKKRYLKSSEYIDIMVQKFLEQCFIDNEIYEKIESNEIFAEQYKSFNEKNIMSLAFDKRILSRVNNEKLLKEYFTSNISNYKDYSNNFYKLANEEIELVKNDMINYLQNIWIKQLKKKYQVKINKQILNNIN
jgi:peptidyl-prolyl cis-trans isomerase SurA